MGIILLWVFIDRRHLGYKQPKYTKPGHFWQPI